MRTLGRPIAIQAITCNWLPGDLHMVDHGPQEIVDEHRAAVLLGLAPPELRWFSQVLGLGKKQDRADASEMYFTYDELKRLSSAAAASAK